MSQRNLRSDRVKTDREVSAAERLFAAANPSSAPKVKYQRRTTTIEFMGSRPDAEQIENAAKERSLGQYGWEVTRIGALTVGRTRRGSTYFSVRVSYRKPTTEAR